MWDDSNALGKIKVVPGDKVTIEVPAWGNCKY